MKQNTVADERSNGSADHDWLAGLLLRRDDAFWPRFAYFYRRIAARPRSWRRNLRRKLAVTVTGAALLLALAGGPVATSVLAEPIETNATIRVVNGEVAIADNNKCSLIEAISNARATAAGQLYDDCRAGRLNGPDTVSLPSGGEFVLTMVNNSQDGRGPTGLPIIDADVTIEGHGATIRRSDVSGTPQFRILAVDENGSLTLRDTTIQNGDAYWYYDGGGIFSQGQLTIENSTLSGNNGYEGGGVSATAVTITGSRIIDNRADGPTGGTGGGIFAQNLTLIDSTVAGNTADGEDEFTGHGGGVYVVDGIISGSTISGNQAEYSFYYYEIEPGRGGGVYATGTLTIANSTISGNEANEGGGLFVRGDTTLVQSTVSGNNAPLDTVDYDGEHFATDAAGGGVFVGAVEDDGQEYCGTATMKGVILSGNTTDDAGREAWVDGAVGICAPVVNTDAFNVFGHDGDSGLAGFTPGATDIVPAVGLGAVLGPLADNGGPTQTHALPAGSPALDLAPSASCTAAPVNGVDQRDEPRNADGAGGASANECDAGSYERQAGGALLVTPARKGTVDGLAFTPADILKYDPEAGWSMYFDGSDVGVTRNLSAFEVLDNGDILMSFAANQKIAGVGTFTPQDIARFVPATTGDSTSGSFQWQLDGSTVGLMSSGEKIDALAENPDGRIAISTTGTAIVSRPEGGRLKAQDEDALGFNFTLQRWSALFDGTAIPGLKAEDVNGMWIDPATGDVYISIPGAFNLGGVRGNGRDVVRLTPSGAPGGYTPSLWWDGSAVGLPVDIDGLEILP